MAGPVLCYFPYTFIGQEAEFQCIHSSLNPLRVLHFSAIHFRVNCLQLPALVYSYQPLFTATSPCLQLPALVYSYQPLFTATNPCLQLPILVYVTSPCLHIVHRWQFTLVSNISLPLPPPLSFPPSPSPSFLPSLSLPLFPSLSLPPTPQSYKSSEDEFNKWLTDVSRRLEERVAIKRPIGTIHNETEDFLVRMIIGVGTGGPWEPNILGGGGPVITQLLFESSICNPVDSKCYWSIAKFVRFAPPSPTLFMFLLH